MCNRRVHACEVIHPYAAKKNPARMAQPSVCLSCGRVWPAGPYSIFDSALNRNLKAKWLFPQEKATLHDLKMSTSESKMPLDKHTKPFCNFQTDRNERRKAVVEDVVRRAQICLCNTCGSERIFQLARIAKKSIRDRRILHAPVRREGTFYLHVCRIAPYFRYEQHNFWHNTPSPDAVL